MADISVPKYVPISKEEWNDRWEKGIHNFHKEHAHEFLQKHVDKLFQGRRGLKVLVPMCGKSVDMKWLVDKGHTVIGVEWAKEAVLRFFKEQNLEYTEEPLPHKVGELYKSVDGRIRIYKCNVFDFCSRAMEVDFDVIWDRGACGIVNPEDREKYAKQITTLTTRDCRIFLATIIYDTSKWPGPPHCIPYETIQELYGAEFNVQILDHRSMEDIQDFYLERGLTLFDEVLYLLTRI